MNDQRTKAAGNAQTPEPRLLRFLPRRRGIIMVIGAMSCGLAVVSPTAAVGVGVFAMVVCALDVIFPPFR